MHELESSLEINKFHIINILEMFDLMSLTSLSTYKVRPSSPDGERPPHVALWAAAPAWVRLRWWWWCSSGPTALPPALPRGARPACRIQARCGGSFFPHEGLPRSILSFHCWLYSLCIVVYVTNKTWNLNLNLIYVLL